MLEINDIVGMFRSFQFPFELFGNDIFGFREYQQTNSQTHFNTYTRRGVMAFFGKVSEEKDNNNYTHIRFC